MRRMRSWIALLAGLSLAGCGSPNDIPTADDATGARAVAAVSTTLPTSTLVPTPTLVPTTIVDYPASPTIDPAGGAVTPTAAAPSASPSVPPTAQPSAPPAATMLPTPSAVPSASSAPGASPAPSDPATDGEHPIARLIAGEFGVSVAEVEAYHAQGIGYGILAQFYSIAYQRCTAQSSYTIDQLVAMKLSGMGMGEIRKQALGSAGANGCSLGRLKQSDLDAADGVESEPDDDKGNNGNRGKDNSDDKDKGNNGNRGKDNSDDKDKGNNGNRGKDNSDDKDKGSNGNSGSGGGNGGSGNGGGKGKDK